MLLKKARSQDRITFFSMLEAIEAIFNEVSTNPAEVVVAVFRLHYKSPKSINSLGFDDLLRFFREFETYFEASDITEFMEEVKLIMREKLNDQTISAIELGCRLRNDIECLPK